MGANNILIIYSSPAAHVESLIIDSPWPNPRRNLIGVLISRLSRSHANSSAFLQAVHKYENKHGAQEYSAVLSQQGDRAGINNFFF